MKMQLPFRRIIPFPSFPWLAAAALVFAGVNASFGQVPVNNIFQLANDGAGVSALAGTTNWSNLLAPFSGNGAFTNAYSTVFTLRTPINGAFPGDIVFGGDWLTLSNSTGALGMKCTNVVVIPSLLISGGAIQNAGTGANPDIATLAGNITLTGNATFTVSSGASNRVLNLQAPITGTGNVAIGGSSTNSRVVYSAPNSYVGTTTVSASSTTTGAMLQMGATNAFPNGPGMGTLTLNAGSVRPALLDLNGYDTAINSITTTTSGTSLTGVITNSSTTPCTLTLGGAGFTTTIKGFLRDNAANGGTLGLTVTGASESDFVQINTTNSYGGDTTINGGILYMGASNILPFGHGKGNLIVTNTGILDMDGRGETVNGLLGNGTIQNSLVSSGNATLNFGSNDVSSVFSGVIQSVYSGALFALQKWGAGTVTLTGANTFNGNVTVNSGILQITQNTSLGVTTTNKTISIVNAPGTAGNAGLYLLGTNGPITLDTSLSFLTASPSGAIANEAGNNVISGPISLTSGSGTTIRADSDTLTLAGNINIVTNTSSRTLTVSGAANGLVTGLIADGGSVAVPNTNILSLTKSGDGIWTLANNNPYSDVTTINAGTLALGASGAIPDTSTITLQSNATFDVSAITIGWSLGANQTLSGSGNINGAVTVNGTVAPGTPAAIGALIFANQLTLANATWLKINRTALPANADSITAPTVICGGTLTVTNAGDPLQSGDSFTLFPGGLSGAFAATNLPAISAPLYWNTSRLGSQGIVSVASSVVPQPYITGITLSGSSLVLSGTNGTVGQQFVELASTNLALPLTNWTPVYTNTFGAGNFSVTNPVDSSIPLSFYILRVP
jgi:autotransporter-associated beta strand protein